MDTIHDRHSMALALNYIVDMTETSTLRMQRRYVLIIEQCYYQNANIISPEWQQYQKSSLLTLYYSVVVYFLNAIRTTFCCCE